MSVSVDMPNVRQSFYTLLILLQFCCCTSSESFGKWRRVPSVFQRQGHAIVNNQRTALSQKTITPLTSLQVQSVLAELSNPSDWTPVRQGDIAIWKRGHQTNKNEDEDHASFAVKATKDMPVPHHIVSKLLLTRDYAVIRRFNPTIQGGRDLETYTRARITHVLTKPQFFLRPRDFVCLVQWKLDDDDIHDNTMTRNPTHIICNTPVSHHPQAPITSQYCRGRLRGLHVVQATSPTTCRYTCVHEIDPGGWAPRRLVNLFALRKPPMYMKQVEDVAREWYANEAPTNEKVMGK